MLIVTINSTTNTVFHSLTFIVRSSNFSIVDGDLADSHGGTRVGIGAPAATVAGVVGKVCASAYSPIHALGILSILQGS